VDNYVRRCSILVLVTWITHAIVDWCCNLSNCHRILGAFVLTGNYRVVSLLNGKTKSVIQTGCSINEEGEGWPEVCDARITRNKAVFPCIVLTNILLSWKRVCRLTILNYFDSGGMKTSFCLSVAAPLNSRVYGRIGNTKQQPVIEL
jgi:hypothetical protein